MEILRIVLVLVISTSRAAGKTLNDSVSAIEHLVMSFDATPSVDAYVCWELGERI